MVRLKLASAIAALVVLLGTTSTSAEPGITVFSPYNTIKWFFPEGGATGPGGHPDYNGFQTYYHFANLNDVSVVVEAYFQGDAGAWTHEFSLAPWSRTSIPFGSMSAGRLGFHAAEFYSKIPGKEIQVSSTMFNQGWEGFTWESSKAVNGSSVARQSWSFGEGGIFSFYGPTNGPVFNHFYAIYNPNPGPINVTVQYHPDELDYGGAYFMVTDPVRTVAGRSRLTFDPWINVYPWNAMNARASTVICSQECVAQMTMYQLRNTGTRRPNTQSSLGSNPATTWYVVGIPTSGPHWQHRIYFYNASSNYNTIRLKYRDAAGVEIPNSGSSHVMPPHNRGSYDLSGIYPGSLPGLVPAPDNRGGHDLSLEITADYPIVLSKIMYWAGWWNWNEGATTTGHSTGGKRLIFPGGNSGGGFNQYIQVMNVGDGPTNVWVTAYRPSGSVPERYLGVLQAKGMLQIDAEPYWGTTGDVATVIRTDLQPVIGEQQVMYAWDHMMWRAGDSVEAIVTALPTIATPNPPPIQP